MKQVHFIAIGGAVMHNLAIALHKKGFQVSGSDDEINEPSYSRLKAYDLLPAAPGWFPERITNTLDAVILGMHARKDNPELLKAQEINVPVYSFPEFLLQQTSDKLRVVIGGSHGKTTITSMIMHVLQSAGKDFDYMVGASIEGFDTMVKLTSKATLAVFEGDEYLSSAVDPRPKFHLYRPKLALLSGIAWDHINVFPTRENYIAQFAKFLQLMEADSVLVWCSEDETLAKVVSAHGSHLRLRPYQTPPHRIENNQTILSTSEGDIPLKIFGKHNLLNLEGARLVCDELNLESALFYQHIKEFKGAARRLELLHSAADFSIYRDFAHSPSKLKATVAATKAQFPERKLVACMELHTFSSLTPAFLEEYKGSMDDADQSIVFFNPEAIRAKRLEPISESQIREAFGRHTEIYSSSDRLRERLESENWRQKTLLLMSSGSFGGIDLKKLSDALAS